MLDFSLPIKFKGPAYCNFGYGYFINKTSYLAALAGVYSPTINKMKFNIGCEFGIINKRVVTAVFINNNHVAGIKIGYKIK